MGSQLLLHSTATMDTTQVHTLVLMAMAIHMLVPLLPTPMVLLSQLIPQPLLLPRMSTLLPRVRSMPHKDLLHMPMLELTAMATHMPVPLLPTQTVLLSQLIPHPLLLPRVSTLLPRVLPQSTMLLHTPMPQQSMLQPMQDL